MEGLLFKGITDENIQDMKDSGCLYAKKYLKEELIFCSGETTEVLGYVLEGAVNIENITFWGNRTLLSVIEKGQVFGENYALSREPFMVDAVSAKDSEILFLNVDMVLNGSFVWQKQMVQNLMLISARKSLRLSSKIFFTSSHRIRDRVSEYLSWCAKKAGSREFDIPMNRQELADFLNVERTALSKELSKMEAEGLIEVYRNHFKLLGF